MNTITVTCELNARNLTILSQLCDLSIGLTTPAVNTADQHPVENPFPAEPVKSDAPKITMQDVKAVCLKMSKAGRQDELKAAFAKFGGKKLSDIAEADYAALMKELGDA